MIYEFQSYPGCSVTVIDISPLGKAYQVALKRNDGMGIVVTSIDASELQCFPAVEEAVIDRWGFRPFFDTDDEQQDVWDRIVAENSCR